MPGYFSPVRIGERSFIDGGVHSPTNAAILRNSGVELTVIISPMSGDAGWRPGFYAAARRYSSRLLDREVRALHKAGIATVVFAPGPAEQKVMGDDVMSREHLQEVIQESFLGAGRQAAAPAVGNLIRLAANG